jgi:hypothetical protein
MRKRGPNDDEMLAAILAGLPADTLAELLEADGVVATAVGSDDLDGVIEDSDKLRRELGLTQRKKK